MEAGHDQGFDAANVLNLDTDNGTCLLDTVQFLRRGRELFIDRHVHRSLQWHDDGCQSGQDNNIEGTLRESIVKPAPLDVVVELAGDAFGGTAWEPTVVNEDDLDPLGSWCDLGDDGRTRQTANGDVEQFAEKISTNQGSVARTAKVLGNGQFLSRTFRTDAAATFRRQAKGQAPLTRQNVPDAFGGDLLRAEIANSTLPAA